MKTTDVPYRCETCGGEGTWTVTRKGDVAVSWGCNDHLAEVCDRFQRDFEVTELGVTISAKAREVAEINRMVRAGFAGE